VFKRIKPVELGSVLAVLDGLQFVSVNQGGGKYPCEVVVGSTFPSALKSFIEGLALGGKQARAILRRLSPRQSIPPHVDDWMSKELNWRRFQVPLVTHPSILMRWPEEGIEIHLEPGFLWEVCVTRQHEVINNADISRIHLQIDQVNATIQ
jgi:hypothetical protein